MRRDGSGVVDAYITVRCCRGGRAAVPRLVATPLHFTPLTHSLHSLTLFLTHSLSRRSSRPLRLTHWMRRARILFVAPRGPADPFRSVSSSALFSALLCSPSIRLSRALRSSAAADADCSLFQCALLCCAVLLYSVLCCLTAAASQSTTTSTRRRDTSASLTHSLSHTRAREQSHCRELRAVQPTRRGSS